MTFRKLAILLVSACEKHLCDRFVQSRNYPGNYMTNNTTYNIIRNWFWLPESVEKVGRF